MNTQSLLSLAHKAEAAGIPQDHWRLAYHLMPPVGWLNNPNGLCQFGQDYHIFFQYNPLGVTPQDKNYWGHYTTQDFTTYRYHTPALCCDTAADAHGVYSGSAYVEDGVMSLYYTGNVKHPGNHDYTHTGREHNTMKVTSRDGLTFSQKKVLMTNGDYPEDVTLHVRDPKVFTVNHNKYMVLGARRQDDVGEVLIYKEGAPDTWALVNTLTAPLGYMWECPDIFTLENQTFLSLSPQGVPAQGDDFQNVYQSGTMALTGDLEGDVQLGTFTELDHGFDFYAPQTFLDNQGRRILMAWMGLPDIEEDYSNPTAQNGWVHALTLPRQLTLNHGQLCQQPLEELKALRQKKTTIGLHGDQAGIHDAQVFEAILTNCHPKAPFSVFIGKDCRLFWDGQKLALFFKESGYGRRIRKTAIKEVYRLHIFVDHSSVEVFVNDGSTVFTSRYYPKAGDGGIQVKGMTGQLDHWPLSPFNLKH